MIKRRRPVHKMLTTQTPPLRHCPPPPPPPLPRETHSRSLHSDCPFQTRSTQGCSGGNLRWSWRRFCCCLDDLHTATATTTSHKGKETSSNILRVSIVEREALAGLEQQLLTNICGNESVGEFRAARLVEQSDPVSHRGGELWRRLSLTKQMRRPHLLALSLLSSTPHFAALGNDFQLQ